jgi:hypothetical protein
MRTMVKLGEGLGPRGDTCQRARVSKLLIEDMVREVSQHATEWYTEARRELDQRVGV